MNAPVTTERKSFLPLRLRSTTIVGSSNNIPTASHPTTPVRTSMSLTVQNDTKSLLTVGNRVLVNGLKSGILRYIGSVEFAQGLFCGVELDEPDGKHDGQVNNIRYFQCKTNHGIFVPQDKVVLASRERAYTIQRPPGRLKPPTMTRSMTISSSTNNKNEKIPIKPPPKTVQLPDIIPNPSTPTQPLSTIKTINDPINTNHHEIITPTENIQLITSIQPLAIDEPPETIEADFTDSVSLILHQLQQEQQSFPIQSRPSITISEEGTIDEDDDDDDDDISDVESIAESIFNEKLSLPSINDSTKSIQTDLSIDVNENITIMKNNLLNSPSLISSTISLNKLKINSIENINKKKPNLPTPTLAAKKIVPERKLSVPTDKPLPTSRKPSLSLTNPPRRSSLIPPKPVVSTLTKSRASLGSQSKLNQSLSSSASVNSSQSDLTTSPKKPPGLTRGISHSIDFSTEKKTDVFDQQLIIQKIVIQSLESTNEYLKKQYQHLLNQFDLMYMLSQYYINKNEQIKQEYEIKLSKVRIKNNQLKTTIEQLKSSHENELVTLNEQNENEINSLKQETVKYQQEIDKLLNEKLGIETRCISLQEEVDRYMYEMVNSEYADPLLRRVEILEKDRTSLETVLELRTQELTQLRTRMNEQVFEREDQLALQKRIDMAENRNQDLICLLRNWQLNEKAVNVECEQLKEQLAQLERDNRQLTFENETLLYTLRQRSPTISDNSFSAIIAHSKLPRPIRAHSFSSIITTIETDHLKHSLSLNCILNR